MGKKFVFCTGFSRKYRPNLAFFIVQGVRCSWGGGAFRVSKGKAQTCQTSPQNHDAQRKKTALWHMGIAQARLKQTR